MLQQLRFACHSRAPCFSYLREQQLEGAAAFHAHLAPEQVHRLDAMRALVDRVEAVVAVELFHLVVARVAVAAVQDAAATTRQLLSVREANLMLANASVYLEMLGHVVIAWIWLRQAVVAQRALATSQGDDKAFYQGKLQACRYFFLYELPKTTAQNQLLRSVDPTCLEMRDEWF